MTLSIEKNEPQIMAESTKRSFWYHAKYWVIIMALLGVLFEMTTSIIYSYKYGGGKFAIVQLGQKLFDRSPSVATYHNVHKMVRPDSSTEISSQIADEIWAANKYSYEPWLQFKVSDYKSKYVNISGFERKSIPNEFINPASRDTLDVYFFGGSTMYGYNVSDAETIPSQFLRIYKNKFPKGKSIRIHNLGVPYYYSKQELLLLSKLIFDGQRPDIVVFMDGLNDFYPSRMLYYDRPHFSYAMQQVFDDRMFLKKKRTIVDSSDQFYIDPPHIPAKDYYNELAGKYLNNVNQATKLCETIGAKGYFFCQPVPFYKYTNRAKDPISYKVDYARFDHIYPAIEAAAQQSDNLVFLGNMLVNETGLPFVDQVHYSPAFSIKIAEQIFSKVENQLQ